MRYYETTFFCDKDNPPKAHINFTKDEHIWPVTLTINGSDEEYSKPAVKIHIYSLEDLIRFRNSVMFQVDMLLANIENKEEDLSNG